MAACFFVAVAFGFRYFESRRRFDLVLAGIATGLLAGVKYFALGYAALVIAVIVPGAALAWGWRAAWRSALVLALVAPLFGGCWYLRNYLVSGAPLYPQGADALGTGYPAPLWSTTLVGNRSPELFRLACEALWKMTGPCHVAAVVLAPLSAVCLAGTGVRRLRQGERGTAAVFLGFAALLVGSAAVFVVTPMAVEDQPGTLNHLRWAYTPARYGLCFLSVAALAFVWLLQQLCESCLSLRERGYFRGAKGDNGPPPRLRFGFVSGALRVGLQGLLAAGLGWQIYLRLSYLSHHSEAIASPDLVGAGVAGLNLFAACWLAREVWRAMPRHRRALATTAAVALLVGSSAGAAMLSRHWHAGYARHYDMLFGTRVFTHLAKEPAQTIAVLDDRSYAFFGSARQNRVCAPRILTTYDALGAYLEARGPSVVASRKNNTGQAFDRYKQGPEWLKSHDGDFRPLMASGSFQLLSWEGSAFTKRHSSPEAIRPHPNPLPEGEETRDTTAAPPSGSPRQAAAGTTRDGARRGDVSLVRRANEDAPLQEPPALTLALSRREREHAQEAAR